MLSFISTDIYHTTFDWPPNGEIQNRLEETPGYTEEDMVNKLIEYHRHIDEILECYKKVVKTVNADQPKADVFSQGVYFGGRWNFTFYKAWRCCFLNNAFWQMLQKFHPRLGNSSQSEIHMYSFSLLYKILFVKCECSLRWCDFFSSVFLPVQSNPVQCSPHPQDCTTGTHRLRERCSGRPSGKQVQHCQWYGIQY